jgi:DNA-binding PadR family transcriptional regulator
MKKRRRDPDRADAFLPLKPAVFHILLALSGEDLHGYGIMKAVEDATGSRIRLDPSPLYRRLRRLLEDGIVAEGASRPASEIDDERRRYYRLTSLGRELLAAEAARIVALSNDRAVQALASEAE